MFFPVGSENSVEFPHACIRGCANNDRHFKLETGRNSPTGSGSLVIDCDDKDVTHHLHETMLRAMQSTKNRDLYLPRSSRNRSQVSTHTHSDVTKVIKHGIPRYSLIGISDHVCCLVFTVCRIYCTFCRLNVCLNPYYRYSTSMNIYFCI